MEQEPVSEPARLLFGDRHEVHASGQHHRHHDAHAERHFVTDHLSSLAHRPEQRPLRGRGIPGEDHAEDLQPKHGDHEEHADVEPLPDDVEREGQADEGTERGAETHVGRDPEKHAVGPIGHQVFLGQEFDAVGERLEPAELPARSSGAKTVLDAAGNLSLRPDENERATGDHVKDQHGRDDGRDRPRQPRRQAQSVDQKVSHRSAFRRLESPAVRGFPERKPTS